MAYASSKKCWPSVHNAEENTFLCIIIIIFLKISKVRKPPNRKNVRCLPRWNSDLDCLQKTCLFNVTLDFIILAMFKTCYSRIFKKKYPVKFLPLLWKSSLKVLNSYLVLWCANDWVGHPGIIQALICFWGLLYFTVKWVWIHLSLRGREVELESTVCSQLIFPLIVLSRPEHANPGPVWVCFASSGLHLQ